VRGSEAGGRKWEPKGSLFCVVGQVVKEKRSGGIAPPVVFYTSESVAESSLSSELEFSAMSASIAL
jgi:hypothetical protein